MEGSAGETVQVVMGSVPVEVGDVVQGKSALNADGGFAKEELIRKETAALEVQRVFRGHRTRRHLADAATIAHKFGWWNVVEGAVLQHHSSNFYAYKTPQSAAQRWLRLKKKAAKVGKGLSKNDKARKLAVQHWLEAIDPSHRYGHNLHFYYDVWDNCQTHEPFFYWLDIGEGKDVDLEKCKRSKLRKELIRYLSPVERKWFEVEVKQGKLYGKMTGKTINTSKGDKWIFVMSTTGKLYVGKKERGKLQHSSFLAGGATTAAGRLLVKDGTIELMEAHSGHYRPTPENFDQLISILTSSGADLTLAKVQVVSDDMLSINSNSGKSIGVNSDISQADFPIILEDVQKQDLDNEDSSIREVASLDLNAEQNGSYVDTVTVMEKTCPHEDEGVVIEGLNILQFESTLGDSGVWEKLEGMKVEIIRPGKTSVSEYQIPAEQEASSSGNDDSVTSSAKLPPTSASSHKLLAPALQTVSRLEDRAGMYSADLYAERTLNTAEQTPDTNDFLLPRLSLNRPVGTLS